MAIILTIEVIKYNSERERDADKRIRYSDGWTNKHNTLLPDGKWELTWVNGTDILQPPPKRQLTRRQFEDELANNTRVVLTD